MRVITGSARGRKLKTPENYDIRPTTDNVKEALFNIIQFDIEGRRVLDLFAGSGALSLEALSRGAARAVMVDRDREAHRVETMNAQRLGYGDRVLILHSDWRPAVGRLLRSEERFNLVFLDPPYAMENLRDVTAGLLPMLSPDALVVTEHQADHPYAVCEALREIDSRRWGYAGVTLYRVKEAEKA